MADDEVRLSKRRKTAGAQVARSRLVVKHRDLNDRELRAQYVWLMMLEQPQDEEEEEEEEFIQTTTNDDEFPSPKGSGDEGPDPVQGRVLDHAVEVDQDLEAVVEAIEISKSGSRSRSRSRSGSRSLDEVEAGHIVAAGVLVVHQADLDQGQAVAAEVGQEAAAEVCQGHGQEVEVEAKEGHPVGKGHPVLAGAEVKVRLREAGRVKRKSLVLIVTQ
ncbi:hypothetical protein MAR_002144, partial [Mya arenaria]